ncbi:MAG: hypothetical protein JWQ68_1654 [Cryobacterium sp.]|jgi:hypothetical protein|nr:hypothetical protein [Cryobacterium sp.]
MSDYHPELDGYEPHDDRRPLRGRRVTIAMRVVVVLGLIALVVPGVLTSMQVAAVTAAHACAGAVARYYPNAERPDSRFDLTGPGGLGWQCYAVDRNEREIFVLPLGIIPAAPRPVPAGIRS